MITLMVSYLFSTEHGAENVTLYRWDAQSDTDAHSCSHIPFFLTQEQCVTRGQQGESEDDKGH